MYFFLNRDKENRATLVIDGIKIGRVHFREHDAWLSPYNNLTLKNKEELEKLGLFVEKNDTNHTFPIKVFISSCDEKEIASILKKAFCEFEDECKRFIDGINLPAGVVAKQFNGMNRVHFKYYSEGFAVIDMNKHNYNLATREEYFKAIGYHNYEITDNLGPNHALVRHIEYDNTRLLNELFDYIASVTEPSNNDEYEEAFNLIEKKPLSQLENLIMAFKNKIKEYQADYEELESLRKVFVDYYNMKRLMEMQKEDYVVGLVRHDTFCYRLESELNRLGDIHNATAKKFGLYYGTLGDDQVGKYHLAPEFGKDINAGFDEIKKEIVYLRMAGDSNNYDKIRECKLSPLLRGKILSTFFPEKYLAIFSKEHLMYFLTKLGLKNTSDDVLDMQVQLINWKKSQELLKKLNNYLFIRFLYASFGRPLEKDSNAQDQRDKEYPQDFVSKINITTSQWKDLLRDPKVFREKDLELIRRFYISDNHAATCYDLGAQDGVSPSTYIKPVVALARRVQDKMSVPPIFGTNGKETWWRILFWGRYREDGHFEWKVRPELAKAVEALYPEFDVYEINDEEDEKLVTDLKHARFVNVRNDFEYEGMPKEKPSAIYVSGHKTYPRDRQTAINALVHARYLCEIDNAHITFIRRNSDKPYTEPHHLVPLAFYDEFDVSLDIEENIVSLCSNCHNQIHYGKDAGVLLKKLYNERKDVLKKAGINITFNRLLSMYGIQSSEDEEK